MQKSNTSTNSSKPRDGHLYTTGKKRLWQLQYDVLGKRTRISLRTSDKREAESRAQEILGRIKFVSTRQEYLQALVKMGDEAQRELSGIDVRRACIFGTEAFELYLKASRRPRKANEESLQRYKSYTNHLVSDMEMYHVDTLDDVDDDWAELYMKELEFINSAATVTMKLNWFKLLWNTLQVTPNPWEGLRTAKKADSKPWRRFTHEECVRIYEAAEEHKWLIALGYYSGQRLKDCCLLDGWKITYDPDVMRLKQCKTGKTVYVPLMMELRRHLIKQTWSPLKASRDIKKIMANVGIEDNGSRVGFHSFRKTFVSMMDEAGAPVFVTNSITGHDSGTMHARYSQTDVETAREWMEKALKPLSTI